MKKAAILCVDDERVVLTSLKSQLKRAFGDKYEIETAESGDEAVEIIAELLEDKIDIQLVISDQIMPGMKGDELLHHVSVESSRTMTVMLTGQADAQAVGRAVNSGNLFRYITKPWDEMDLNLTVKEALRSYAQERKIADQNLELEKLVSQLKNYNESLESTVQQRTAEISKQKKLIQKKNDDMMGSLRYALKIQEAMLPPQSILNETFSENFIFYKPLDIVSGDFYWFTKHENKIIVTAADCTGHGVPGAFMSMLGITFFDEIVNNSHIIAPNEILNKLRANIIKSFHKSGDRAETKDGMDLALLVADLDTMKMEFSGAYNPLVLIRDNEIHVYKADRMPAGYSIKEQGNFSKTEIDIKKGDALYLYSDGFVDQFGGPRNKKFMAKRFRKLLLEIHRKPMAEQNKILESTLKTWQGGCEQIDDIIVLGIKV